MNQHPVVARRTVSFADVFLHLPLADQPADLVRRRVGAHRPRPFRLPPTETCQLAACRRPRSCHGREELGPAPGAVRVRGASSSSSAVDYDHRSRTSSSDHVGQRAGGSRGDVPFRRPPQMTISTRGRRIESLRRLPYPITLEIGVDHLTVVEHRADGRFPLLVELEEDAQVRRRLPRTRVHPSVEMPAAGAASRRTSVGTPRRCRAP